MKLFLSITLLAFATLSNAQMCLSAAGSFSLEYSYQPAAIISADFNNDNLADVAVAEFSSVSVLLGTGNGSFSPTTYTGFPTNYCIVSADFNMDGFMDIAAAGNSPHMGVLLSTGNGSFGTVTLYTLTTGVKALATGDFNGDSKADLIAAGGLTTTLLSGTGTGSFNTSTSFTITEPISEVSTGDFNNDGKADLAFAHPLTQKISSVLGNGLGGFGTPATFSVGGLPVSIAAKDLNNDNKADLVVANMSANGKIAILLATGNGSFTSMTEYPVGWQPHSIAFGDMDNDNQTDIATLLKTSSSRSIAIIPGNGTGTFGTPWTLANVATDQAITAADLNNDGRMDLVATQSQTTHPVTSFLNCKMTGLSDISGSNAIRIYPNPAGDAFTVSGLEELASVDIIDLQGKKIASLVMSDIDSFATGTLENGSYILMIRTSTAFITKKLVIIH